MFRRNFTFGLAMPTANNDGAAWAADGTPPTDWQFTGTGDATHAGDMTAIACAVNTFDQEDVFRYQYNGLCWNNAYRDGTGWGQQPAYSRCTIDFGAATTGSSQKRAIGEYNGWKVYGTLFFVLLCP